MKSMLKDALILFGITLLAGLILASVYQITKEPIKKQQELAQANACKEVFENAETFEEITFEENANPTQVIEAAGYANVTIEKVLTAKDAGGNVLGCVMSVVSHEGYGGDIGFYMGVTNEGLLNGISILSISETPGLGMKAEEVLKPQFDNKQVQAFTSTKSGSTNDSEIDAISGATITTDAITNAVNAGLNYFRTEWTKLNGGAE